MKAGLTFACMNLKKLAKILEKRGWNTARFLLILKKIKRKEVLKKNGAGHNTQHQFCLQSETLLLTRTRVFVYLAVFK